MKNSKGEYEELTMEKQPLLLLFFFLFNHRNKVSKQTLFDVFWSKSTNPENAIKFAIFRLRKALEEIPELSDKNFILSSNGYYYINKDYEINLDVEDFNDFLINAKNNNDLSLYNEVINLYNGDLLYGVEYEYLNQYRTYYLNQFIDVSEFLSERYLHFFKYQECIDVCLKALKFDPFNEKIIMIYFEALIKNGEKDKISEKYNEICLLAKKKKYTLLQINQNNIDDLIKNCNPDLPVDIQDNEFAYGPYFVDKKVFLSLNEVYRRLMNRYGITFYVFDFKFESDQLNISDFINVISLTLRRTDTIYVDKNHVYTLSALKKNEDHLVLYNRLLVGMSLRYDKDIFKLSYDYRPL